MVTDEKALVPFGPDPPALPEGWWVVQWELTRHFHEVYGHPPLTHAGTIRCVLAHSGGAEVDLELTGPVPVEWLWRYLVVAQDIPIPARVQAEQRRARW